jgi:transcription antitermination factor NusG
MNTSLPNGHWYALCTRSKCEKKVALSLTKKKIETYLPLRTSSIQWGFLRKTEHEPLFPGIVFVYVEPEQLNAVRMTSGVCGVMHWLNAPACITEGDIDLIRNFLAQHDRVRVARTAVRMEPVCAGEVEEAEDEKVARMQNIISTSLSSLGFVLIADVPAPEKVHNTPVPQIYPYFQAG